MTFPVRVGMMLAVAGGWFLSAPAAFWGTSWAHHQSVTTPFVVFVVVLGPVWWRDRDYLRLPKADRRQVDHAVRHGVPTGAERIDVIAFDRLQRAARGAGSDRIARPIFVTAFVAVPIVAAVRVSPWFLLALLPAPLLISQTIRQARLDDPRERLARWTGHPEVALS